MTTPLQLADTHASIHVSIGIALEDGSHSDAEELLQHADAAMYTAKRHGKDRIAVFTPDEAAVLTRGELHDELSR